MTARYWYRDNDGKVVTMEWRPYVSEEDQPIPDDEAPEELPDEPEQPDIEQPKTDEPEE